MRLTKLTLLGAALVVSSPLFASTYFGGVEDTIRGDMDYQDLVFSLSGTNLTLNTGTGTWFNANTVSSLNTSAGAAATIGTPFWNNPSYDGAGGYNVGWCIYGGGACDRTGIAPNNQYLATAGGGSVNDVTFSVSGDASLQVTLGISALSNTLGWQLTSGGPVHLFSSGTQAPISFTPGGDFVLVDMSSAGNRYASNVAASDNFSHFAFFGFASSGPTAGPTIPEPSGIGLMGLGLLAGGLVFRKRFSAS